MTLIRIIMRVITKI